MTNASERATRMCRPFFCAGVIDRQQWRQKRVGERYDANDAAALPAPSWLEIAQKELRQSRNACERFTRLFRPFADRPASSCANRARIAHGWGEVGRSFAAAVPGLLVIAIILGGILSGVFTATESAATAVLTAVLGRCG